MTSGLVFAYVRADRVSHACGVVFRAMDAANHWRLELADAAAALVAVVAGRSEVVACGVPEPPKQAANQWRRLQVIDDGYRMMALVDGEQLAGAWVEDRRLADASKTGVFVGGHASMAAGSVVSKHIRARFRFPHSSTWVRHGCARAHK